MTLLEADPEPTAAVTVVTAAGSQWKWQLRDKNGRWIQMGSEVSFSQNGKTITGVIVGSSGPGKATVRLANGSTVTVATAGVTSTGKSAGPTAPVKKAAAAAKDAAARGATAQPAKQVKAVSPALKGKPKTSAQKSSEHAARRRRVNSINRIDGTVRSIEDLIRAQAKKKGRKDPFGEKEGSSKSKAGGSKDGKKSGDTKGGSEKGSSAGSKKPRKDTRKKLTQSQIDAVGDIMKGVLADVKRGSYSAALAKLGKAEKLLENTSAPWFSKKINFLQKGLKGMGSLTAAIGLRRVRTREGAQHYGQPIGAVIVADPVSRAIKAALRPGREGWTKVEKYGLDYDPEFAKNPAVVAARALPESTWDDVPVQDWRLPLAGGTPLHANEPDLKDKTLAKVHEPGFEFREGYFNEIVVDTEGRAHIVDGHHRVGLHAEAGHESLPAKVIDVREDTPAAAAVRKAMGISKPLAGPPPHRPSKATTAADYMALRTLRMGAIKAFGGDAPAENTLEFGMARNRALEDLSLAATKDMRRKDAVKKLLDARRQVAAARAWSDLPARQARLATLEAQISQILIRLDPDSVRLPKKVSATTKVKVRQALYNDWVTTTIDRIGTISTLTSAGDSWKWQLRDSKGQWIEMGSEVKWLALGKVYTGKVVGSPEAGTAIVEDNDGNRVRLASSRLTATEAPAATGPVMVTRRERRQAARQERKQQKATITKQTPAMAAAMRDMADGIRDNVAPENQAAAAEATVDVIVGDIAGNLPKRMQLLERVKTLREKGVDAQRRLAIYFHTREAHSKHLAKAHFWANEFLGDMGATDNPTPSWAAIPTLIGLPNPASNPVEFLAESSKMIGQLLKAAGSLVSSAVTAAGDSWKWQLRDADGQWIEMGSRVSWLLKGALRTGVLVGSPKEGTARIRDDETGRESNLLASRLTALPDVGARVRYTTPKDQKGTLAEVIGLPKQGKVTIRDLRTGKEKTISEATARVVDVEEMPPAVGDRKYMTPPPPVGGLRIVEAKSSITAHGPSAQDFINNDGGTLADPKHLRTNSDPKEGEPPAEMTASMSVLADHFTEVLRAAQAGVPYSDKADPAEMDAAPFWYERAHQTCLDLLEEFGYKVDDDGTASGIPGLTIEKVTGVMAAMSPRTAWPVNIIFCKKILAAEADPEFRKIPTAQAKSMMEAGNNTFTEDSLQILRGEGTPQKIMGGLKRRSFWNSMLDPKNEWDVCIDGWMASGYRRVGLTYLDGTPLDKEGLKWLDDGAAQLQMEDSGAGYVITADAVRIAAARVGLTPLQAQAMYWVSVGGGAKGAKMWTDPPSGSYLAWRQQYLDTQASEREARLAEELRPIAADGGADTMIPEDGGEWMDEDDFDARSIASMAEAFKAERTFPAGEVLSIPSAWAQLQPHPATGGMIEFCWENPAAWETLAGDVDRDWFMEQVTTRSAEPQVTA